MAEVNATLLVDVALDLGIYPGDAHQLVAVFSPQSSFSPPSTG